MDKNKTLYQIFVKGNRVQFSKFFELSQSSSVDIIRIFNENINDIYKIKDNINIGIEFNIEWFKEFILYKILLMHLKNNKDKELFPVLNMLKEKEEIIDEIISSNIEKVISFQLNIEDIYIHYFIDFYLQNLDMDAANEFINKLNVNYLIIEAESILKIKDIRFIWFEKLLALENIVELIGLRREIKFLYDLKSNNLSDEERKRYKSLVNIICEQVKNLNGEANNVSLFDLNMFSMFKAIYEFSNLSRDDKEEIFKKVQEFESIFKNEVFKTKFNFSKEVDFSGLLKFCDEVNIENDLSLFIFRHLELTHFLDKDKSTIGLVLIREFKDDFNKEDLVNIFLDSGFHGFKSWYKPSKMHIIDNNMFVSSNTLSTLVKNINNYENLFLNYIHSFLNEIRNDFPFENQDINNFLEGNRILSINLSLMTKFSCFELYYNLSIVIVNLIESLLKMLTTTTLNNLDLNSLLNSVKNYKFINSDLIEIIRYYLLSSYVKETNSKYGFDIRNNIMHGKFIFDDFFVFNIFILYLSLVNEIYLYSIQRHSDSFFKKKK